jgi:hypothetical protein
MAGDGMRCEKAMDQLYGGGESPLLESEKRLTPVISVSTMRAEGVVFAAKKWLPTIRLSGKA